MTVTRRLRDFDRRVAENAATWKVSPTIARVLLIAPVVATLALAATLPAKSLFLWFVDEDHLIEWSQFVVILAAGVTFAWAAFLAARADQRGLAIFYGLVSGASLIVAGEEISWGQRVLGFATASDLAAINHQGEANIHNIPIFQRLFGVGELVVALYAVIVSLVWLIPEARAWLARQVPPILIPPACLVALFLLPAGYRTFRALLLPEAGRRITEFGELPELSLYVGVLIVGILTVGLLRRGRTSPVTEAEA